MATLYLACLCLRSVIVHIGQSVAQQHDECAQDIQMLKPLLLCLSISTPRSPWCSFVYLFLYVLISSSAISPAEAQLFQADGSPIPATNNLTNILNQPPLNEGIDVIQEASLVPEVFTPSSTLTFSFIEEGGGYENAFGWYNLGDDVTQPQNRFIIFTCDIEPRNPYVTRTVNFCGNPNWKGGPIGFFLITPERRSGGTRFPNCAVNDNVGYIYYSEPRLNVDEDPNNQFIHHLVYRSNTFQNAFYFGFEDLFRGGDNDFEDALILVQGLLVGSAIESCDGVDDDCDGRTDEGADVVCESQCGQGVRRCETGTLSACSAPDPTEESCDGSDNDCDGLVDEGLTQACDLGCGEGVEVCLGGVWSLCTAPTPQAEACNNLDEDCDGITDEGLSEPCANGCGVAGTRSCVSGTFGRCDAPNPIPELCDGSDNDCDGLIDEGIIRACEGTCGVGIEQCVRGVFQGCDALEPLPEVCDGSDNDCDGLVDETLTQACDGGCGVQGQERCLGGDWIGCDAPHPLPERCNGVDDDCDGLSDEDLTQTCESSCGLGSQRCEQGAWSSCNAPIPSIETCDGLDNDCDGRVDEGVTRACRADCGVGTQACVNGVYLACNVPAPQEEICDGLDNDCDGLFDERLERDCSSLCGEGTELCVEGAWVQCSAPSARPETCNAVDDDCDGLIDEALVRSCDNPCGEGMSICQSGQWSTCPASSALPESCDGQDNDCDGISDEQVTCPDEANRCVRGQCVSPCLSGECYVGFECIDGLCLPQPCFSCRAYELCERGRCVDPCVGIQCSEGSFCRAGECLNGDCYGQGCEAGLFCEDGQCVPDDCDLVSCSQGEACERGRCFPTCALITCEEGQRCTRGICLEESCSGQSCAEGERCVNGGCVNEPCTDVVCSPGRICREALCVDDPCLAAHCPRESECIVTAEGLADCRSQLTMRADEAGTTVELVGGEDQPLEAGDEMLPEAEILSSGCATQHRSGAPFTLLLFLGWALFTRLIKRVNRQAKPDPRGPLIKRQPMTASLMMICIGLISCGEDGPSSGSMDMETGGTSPFTINGCTPRIEVCNGEDDDCDGIIDNVSNLDRDPQHCGSCEVACSYPQGEASCVNGICRLSRCEAGYSNADGLSENGCEATCDPNPDLPTGEEICNQRDDDCDGLIDEGYNLGQDTQNCGVCGRSCEAGGVAEASCLSGRCVINACEVGYLNLDGDALNGCEYACQAAGGVELCNGSDDDCDGNVDEDLTLSIVCEVQGLCAGARPACMGEDGEVCSYPEEVSLTGEIRCDGRDEDCDGVIDEDFPNLGAPCDGDDLDLCASGVLTCSGDRSEVICLERINYEERCDGEDNDCDGRVDEGINFLFDPLNCGACGVSCVTLNGEGVCREGRCVMQSCVDGFIDLDAAPETGCEYRCTLDQDSTERCDGVDNDCDGRVDEEVTVPVDVTCLHQGVCSGSSPSCLGNQGFRCTYPDVYEADTETRCDQLDNDCDGLIDEAFPSLGQLCDGSDDDLCLGGVIRCAANPSPDVFVECTDDPLSISERCDGVDNDCDGQLDEGFDLDTNPQHCGRCGLGCGRLNAVTSCVGGLCQIDQCEEGFVDLNGVELDGCEYACARGASQEEVCDGVDNDCDGIVDEELTPPVDLNCEGPGVCFGVQPTCRGARGFECVYPLGVYETPETRCDGVDNDCDGQTDEAGDNPNLVGIGAVCERGEGACYRVGVQVCSQDQQSVRCSAQLAAPIDEICNGVDDDCDGQVDEDLPREVEMTLISLPNGDQVWMDRWEASRPDATAQSEGFDTRHACSKPLVLPWGNVTLDAARQACTARGKRLCTDQEWIAACGSAYPYGDAYDPAACVTESTQPEPTGQAQQCLSSSGIFDLSGNLAEWTECANPIDCQIVSPQLGGSYSDRVIDQWRCDFRGNAVPVIATSIGGFRCCSDP